MDDQFSGIAAELRRERDEAELRRKSAAQKREAESAFYSQGEQLAAKWPKDASEYEEWAGDFVLWVYAARESGRGDDLDLVIDELESSPDGLNKLTALVMRNASERRVRKLAGQLKEIDEIYPDTFRTMRVEHVTERVYQRMATNDARILAERSMAQALETPPVPAPPSNGKATRRPDGQHLTDDGWHIEPGCFWFRRRHFSLTGKPLEILRIFLNSRVGQIVEEQTLDRAWSENDPNATLGAKKQHNSALRKALRTAMEALGIDSPSDPIPHIRNAGWRFDLPRQ